VRAPVGRDPLVERRDVVGRGLPLLDAERRLVERQLADLDAPRRRLERERGSRGDAVPECRAAGLADESVEVLDIARDRVRERLAALVASATVVADDREV